MSQVLQHVVTKVQEHQIGYTEGADGYTVVG